MVKVVRVYGAELKWNHGPKYAIIFDDVNTKNKCDWLFGDISIIPYNPHWGKNIILKFGNDISMVWTAFMLDKSE